MDIPRIQSEIKNWVTYNFGSGTPMSAVVGLSEEVGELCRAILKQHQKIRGTHDEWQIEIAKEIGDAFIKLCDVASEAGIDLEYAIKSRWEIIRQRDFRKDPVGHGIPQDYADSAE